MGGRIRAGVVIGFGLFMIFCGATTTRVPPTVSTNDTPDAQSEATVIPKLAQILDAASALEPLPPNDDPPTRFAAIDGLVTTAIDANKMPGCVVVVGRRDEILFEKAYGSRSLLPERAPMTLDTVFDLASLTKPTATAMSLMLLIERGKVDLDARASTYVPELARLTPFTVRQLLLHTSGLPAATPMDHWSTDRAEVIRRIAGLTLKAQPGEKFNYSDVGFVVLQEIIQRISGKSLAVFAAEEVWTPLGMNETTYLPPPEIRLRAAPTEQRDGGFMQGEVHDPRAFALGGIGGHAGVFSTARDMSRFARSLLMRGEFEGHRVMTEKTFERMITRHDTPKGGRALGWDVDSSFATHRSALLSPKAFGHGGYTGTAMWIDPERDLFILFLSNRVHPDGKGAVNPVVAEIATTAIDNVATKTGIDVLRAENFERLRGAKIGLVTNATAKTKDGTTTIDAIRAAGSQANIAIGAIFTPEHGLTGDREGVIGDGSYNGIPVHSLYGERFTPSASTLDGIDTIVFDLQDVGMRFYTYASTMKRAMKVANDRKLRFVVLDRPNPVNGMDVQGPMLADQDVKGFVNHHALPLRHGMTMGELARLFADDDKMNDLRLDIVKLIGWRRHYPFERTNLTWSPPSPNLRSTKSVYLYPAIGMLESTNVTVGRGTDVPFEIVAAPWMDGEAVARKLNESVAAGAIAGVSFEATAVTPKSAVHANKRCKGIKIKITNLSKLEPIHTAITIANALREVHPTDWDFDGMDKMLRSKPAMTAIRSGKGLAEIEATWATELATFKEKRERFLLYR